LPGPQKATTHLLIDWESKKFEPTGNNHKSDSRRVPFNNSFATLGLSPEPIPRISLLGSCSSKYLVFLDQWRGL
jgi:hypothetical protein